MMVTSSIRYWTIFIVSLVLRIGVLNGFVVQQQRGQNNIVLSESERKLDNGSGDDAVRASKKRNRLKTDFDRLFLGVPSMQEILSGDKRESIRETNSNNKSNQNDAWFAEEQKAIEDTYQRMLHQMLAELQQQRGQDPGAVPSSAEAMLRQVLLQEMNMEIKQMKDVRGKEFFDDQKTLIEKEPNSAAANDLVDELLSRRQSMLKQSGAAESAFVPEYKEYEIDAFDDSYNDDDDDDEQEDGPETMKEWQMYRNIAARLGAEKASEEEILTQYQAWKDYVDTENVHRKKSGLTMGTRLPFAWQEDELAKKNKDAEIEAAIQKYGVKTNDEMRQEVDQKSIEALENLIQKTSDPVRSARLQNTLMLLKEGLETGSLDPSIGGDFSLDELSFDGDISELSGDTTTSSDELRSESDAFLNRLNFPGASAARGQTTPAQSSYPLSTQNDQNDEVNDEDDDEDEDDLPAPLSSTEKTDQTVKSDGKEPEGQGYSLGTIEEQKLRSLYQRSGARTDEEKEAVRAQYEAFNQYEQSMRDANGLSETAGADSTAEDSGVNYSDMTNENGEIDAQKILASIGPRPTRRKKAVGGDANSSPSEDRSSTTEDPVANPTES